MQHNDHLHKEIAGLREQLAAAQERIGYLELQAKDVEDFPGTFNLTPYETVVLSALYRNPGRTQTKEAIFARLHEFCDTDADVKIVDVYICKLRKKLGSISVKIATHWGHGFFMTAENATMLRAAIEAQVACPRLIYPQPSKRQRTRLSAARNWRNIAVYAYKWCREGHGEAALATLLADKFGVEQIDSEAA